MTRGNKKPKTRADAIEDALKKCNVGDRIYVCSESGRTEYCLELILKEVSK